MKRFGKIIANPKNWDEIADPTKNINIVAAKLWHIGGCHGDMRNC
jgi:hypothetical protein